MTSLPHSAGTARPYVWAPDQSPAYWNVGTYWRVLADSSQTDGRSCTFEELCPQGLVAPPHVHDKICGHCWPSGASTCRPVRPTGSCWRGPSG